MQVAKVGATIRTTIGCSKSIIVQLHKAFRSLLDNGIDILSVVTIYRDAVSQGCTMIPSDNLEGHRQGRKLRHEIHEVRPWKMKRIHGHDLDAPFIICHLRPVLLVRQIV